jgi:hypothetical protein
MYNDRQALPENGIAPSGDFSHQKGRFIAMQSNSTWDSIKSLFSPKTIPFLISQGVGPKLLPVGTLVIGLILGFVWAYVISPNVYTGAGPVNLSESWKQEYVKQVAWQFSATGDSNNAKNQLDKLGDADAVVQRAIDAATAVNDTQTVIILQSLKPLAQPNPAEIGKITPGLLNGNLTPILCVIAALIVLGLPVIVNTIIPITLLFQPRSKEKPTVASGQEKIRRDAQEAAKKAAAAAAAAAPPATEATIDRGTPVVKNMSTYVAGDDLYDDSFSIETASGEFLGEMGGGISKTIGVGDPKKVTAVEVWVFDKNDIRTVTKVLMSEHAFNDEAIKAELAPKGEAVLVQPGMDVLLDTQTLTIQARIIDVAYGSGALPPNSYFDRISIEMSAFPKKAPVGGAAPNPAFGDTSAM